MEPTNSPSMADVLAGRAKQEFPILNRIRMGFKYSPRQNDGMLEFWPSGEPGSPDRQRPKEFGLDKPGVEIFSDKTTPLDVMGDITSHYLIESDPRVKAYYSQFQQSLTPQQQDILREQYDWATANAGERRPFEQWKAISGLPAYFRGYPFQQWSHEFNERAYTPEQRARLDEMMRYLRAPNMADELQRNGQ
jgi:hypothetical protein